MQGVDFLLVGDVGLQVRSLGSKESITLIVVNHQLCRRMGYKLALLSVQYGAKVKLQLSQSLGAELYRMLVSILGVKIDLIH